MESDGIKKLYYWRDIGLNEGWKDDDTPEEMKEDDTKGLIFK
jgi:hypothetical protein